MLIINYSKVFYNLCNDWWWVRGWLKNKGKTKRIIIIKPNLSRGRYRHPRLGFHLCHAPLMGGALCETPLLSTMWESTCTSWWTEIEDYWSIQQTSSNGREGNHTIKLTTMPWILFTLSFNSPEMSLSKLFSSRQCPGGMYGVPAIMEHLTPLLC